MVVDTNATPNHPNDDYEVGSELIKRSTGRTADSRAAIVAATGLTRRREPDTMPQASGSARRHQALGIPEARTSTEHRKGPLEDRRQAA